VAGAPSWYRRSLGVLFFLLVAIALTNARVYPPGGGYDAVDHMEYADLLRHGHVPNQVGASEYYSPPGFYAIAAGLTWIGDQFGLGEPHRVVLAFNVLVLAATALLLVALARELWPERLVLHVAALGYFAFLPVTVKLTAMFHPEPLDLLAVTAGLYLAARGPRRGRFTIREAAALGVVLGLALLVRQFALYGVGAALLALLAARHWRVLAIAAAACAIVAGPWYVRQAITYSSPTGFGETSTQAQKSLLTRRPASFYVGTGLPDVLTAPWRPHYLNRAIPTTYSELWGDYFGIWDWKGSSETLTPRVKTDLRVQSWIGLLPTLLAVAGWLALLWRRSWLVALVPLLGFLGYAYFTISYPTQDGDVLKASYMLTTATAWALCFGYAVDRLARRRAVAIALAIVLAASAAAELRFLVY
jgi:4-amino-4-deoxy-L-arabinose transferase-like glycosyltransferase